MVHICSSVRRHFGGKFGIRRPEEVQEEEEEEEQRGREEEGERRDLLTTLTRMQSAGCAGTSTQTGAG